MSRIAPYAEQHKTVTGPGDGRPTAVQVIKDQGLQGKWVGKVVLITGCSPGGIGPETARAIHATGADVYITGRDLKKTEQVADDILSDGKPGKVTVIKMDLNSLASVKQAVREFLSKSNTLNVLINNAGIMVAPESRTEDSLESQLAVNHLAHFYLFQLLKSTLLASSTPEFNSRVVALASMSHRHGEVILEDLQFSNRKYDLWVSYGQAKLANIYFANELDRRYASKGLHAFSIHPGVIDSNLSQHINNASEMLEGVGRKGGKYLEDCAEATPAPSPDPMSGGYSELA